MQPAPAEQRVDKWLVNARFFKTRTLASELVQSGKVRVNGEKIRKPAHQVRAGDALTFTQGRRVRVIKILACALKRGPAKEAQLLYQDLSPPEEKDPARPKPVENWRDRGRKGRTARLSRPSDLE